MTGTRAFAHAIAADLARVGAGQVLLPGDDGYEAARRVWNGAIDRKPAVIVRPGTPRQVAAAVRVAGPAGLPVAVRGGGHSVAGFGTCDDGIVIDLSQMRGTRVEPGQQVASAAPGCTWADFDAATHEYGLATTGGLVSTTGIAGFTLGGGIGWLTRAAGLTCDNLLAVEIVTAAGELVHADYGANEELFWALRGGGGNFGIVTRFDFRLHPVHTAQAGMLLWPADRGQEVLSAYAGWVKGLAESFATMAVMVTAPGIPEVPAQLRGQLAVAIVAVHLGNPAEASADLAPMRALQPSFDHVDAVPYPALQQMFDADVPAGARYYFTGGYADDLSADLVKLITDTAAARPGGGCEIDIHHMGGATDRVRDMDSAYPGRGAAFCFNIIAGWEDPADDASHIGWARATRDAFRPHWRETGYVNFATDTADMSAAQRMYGAARYERLRRVKRSWDPGNLFALNQNIRP